MNVLVVYAHPDPSSFSSGINQLVCSELAKGGHRIQNLDLYHEHFEACMSIQERKAYMTSENIRGIEHYVEQLKWAEALVLVYPTWWMGPPAILKGWFDRIWLPGVVAEFGPEGVKPGLTNIRKIMVITTQGSSWVRMFLIGNPPKRMLKLALKACTKASDIQWLALYSMDKISPPKLTGFLEKIRKKMAAF
ncbi:NAD(P)H-dependent oxidoreductase [Endozoicomonas sp. Mp262]|uniref:NAD(P)H-dependent oxidoreductase n=1 Tax=Endozoicomonas sp. Mp262 TaxID=2919499 RepID=UPI0021DF89D6